MGMTSFIRLFKDIVSLITLSRPFSTWHIQRIYTYSSLLKNFRFLIIDISTKVFIKTEIHFNAWVKHKDNKIFFAVSSFASSLHRK